MKNKDNTILIAGGGTGGHLFPALAIVRELNKKNAIYVGSKFGIESKLNILNDFDKKYFLDITGIHRTFSIKSIINNSIFPYKFIKSYFVSRKIIKLHQPKIIIGTGGYCSGLPLLAGIHMGIPTLIQDQNSVPGLITRKLCNKINTICVAYNNVRNIIKNKNVVVTGNPINPNLYNNNLSENSKNDIKKQLGIDENKKTILFLGGSQGAQAINNHIYNNINFYLKNNYQIILQCGEKNYSSIPKNIIKEKNIIIKKFITDKGKWNMYRTYKIADLVIARAGALTISELTFLGKAMILIPYKYAADNHQEINANSIEKKKACFVIHEDKLKKGILEKTVNNIFNNNKIEYLEKKSLNAAFPEATKNICNEINKLII